MSLYNQFKTDADLESKGVEIDYVTSFMGQGFTFKNPSASGGCGCGSSFTV